MSPLSFLLNILWLIFGGLAAALAWVIAAAIMAITIIGLPWAFAAMRIALYTLLPFGHEIRSRPDTGMLSLLGNIIWFVFLGGFLMGVGWLLAGCILCLTIVGIPFGMACFRIASFAFFPFGKELVDVRALGESRIAGTTLANIVWFVLAGLWLAIGHVVSAIACLASCLLILPLLLGAPAWALAHLNLARVALAPLGKRIVPKGAAYRSQIAVAGSGRLENRLRRLPDPVDEIDPLP